MRHILLRSSKLSPSKHVIKLSDNQKQILCIFHRRYQFFLFRKLLIYYKKKQALAQKVSSLAPRAYIPNGSAHFGLRISWSFSRWRARARAKLILSIVAAPQRDTCIARKSNGICVRETRKSSSLDRMYRSKVSVTWPSRACASRKHFRNRRFSLPRSFPLSKPDRARLFSMLAVCVRRAFHSWSRAILCALEFFFVRDSGRAHCKRKLDGLLRLFRDVWPTFTFVAVDSWRILLTACDFSGF